MGRSWIPRWNPSILTRRDQARLPDPGGGGGAAANRWAEIGGATTNRSGGPYEVPGWTFPRGLGNRMMDDVRLPPGWGGWTRTAMGGVSFDQPRELTFSAADAWIPIVYGEMRVGGVIELLHQESSGDVYAVVTWSIGEVNAISSTPFGADAQINPHGQGAYSSPAVVASYTGTLTQSVDSTLAGLSGVTWDQALTGRAYSVLRVDEDRDASMLERAQAVVQGLKVYDHRTDTTAYSRNPVLLAAALLHAWWGADLGTDALDWDRIDDAADYAEVDVSGEDRFAVDVYIRQGMRLSEALDRVLRHCRGYWDWDPRSGLWYVDIERTGSSVFTFTDTGSTPNIDPRSVVVEPPDRTRLPSLVRVNWTDKANDYQPGGPVVKDYATAVTGAREAYVDLPWCTSRDVAARILNYEYYSRLRDPMRVQWQSTETAAVVEVGDRVTLTAGEILDAQNLIVTGITRVPDGSLAFSGTEHETAAYSDSTEAQDTPPSYTSPSLDDPATPTTVARVLGYGGKWDLVEDAQGFDADDLSGWTNSNTFDSWDAGNSLTKLYPVSAGTGGTIYTSLTLTANATHLVTVCFKDGGVVSAGTSFGYWFVKLGTSGGNDQANLILPYSTIPAYASEWQRVQFLLTVGSGTAGEIKFQYEPNGADGVRYFCVRQVYVTPWSPQLGVSLYERWSWDEASDQDLIRRYEVTRNRGGADSTSSTADPYAAAELGPSANQVVIGWTPDAQVGYARHPDDDDWLRVIGKSGSREDFPEPTTTFEAVDSEIKLEYLANVADGDKAAGRLLRVDSSNDEIGFTDPADGGTPESYVAVTEYGVGPLQKSVMNITLAGANILNVDDGGDGDGKKLYTFPQGRIWIPSAHIVGSATVSGDISGDIKFAVGFAQNSDGTHGATEKNVVDEMTASGPTYTFSGDGPPSWADSAEGTSTSNLAVYLNVVAPDASVDADGETVEVNATLTVLWARATGTESGWSS